MKLPVIAVCWSCAAALARPVGAWVLTDLLPFQHHALIGLALTLVAIWRTWTPASPAGRPRESDCKANDSR